MGFQYANVLFGLLFGAAFVVLNVAVLNRILSPRGHDPAGHPGPASPAGPPQPAGARSKKRSTPSQEQGQKKYQKNVNINF